jgi:hypothetical protein
MLTLCSHCQTHFACLTGSQCISSENKLFLKLAVSICKMTFLTFFSSSLLFSGWSFERQICTLSLSLPHAAITAGQALAACSEVREKRNL